MAKRKAGVSDIIFELDNEDIEISSDEEVKGPKINRLDSGLDDGKATTKTVKADEDYIEVITIDKPTDESRNISSRTADLPNGGKTSSDIVNDIDDARNSSKSHENVDETDSVKKMSTDFCKTTILNEDIVVDSPGNSDLGVEGCENRTPLVTVRFSNKKLANKYKQQIKAFMLNLIKLHEGETTCSDNEMDLEIDIWPEDLNERTPVVDGQVDNNLFFVDTDPGCEMSDDVPRYRQTETVITNIPVKEPTPPPTTPLRRGPTCFNCDGSHPLKDCTKPRDFARIANKRKSLPVRVGRYHVEDEQKYGHLIPGRISGQLRHALGLKRHELPTHIYRMRMLGYPPGWLEEARISHSGISMFDSTGNVILEADDEEGELVEPGSKDKFDIKKILDFPGFNVPPSPRYKEEAHKMGLPPMTDQDSKLAMLQFLAPNAMKAYKRKKLTMFPSEGSNNVTLEGQAEMELDSGDELTEFPSVPPLPDEAPPPNPPPPPPPPSGPPPESPQPPPPTAPTNTKENVQENTDNDLEVVEVLKVDDIPIPMADFIVIDEDDSEVEETESSGRVSPSLDDLEAKKQLLLDALEVSVLEKTTTETEDGNTVDEVPDLDLLSDDAKDTIDGETIDKSVDDTAAVTSIVNSNKNEVISSNIDVAVKENIENEENTSDNDTNNEKNYDDKDTVVAVTDEHSQESTVSNVVDTIEISSEVTTPISVDIDTQESTTDAMDAEESTDTQESTITLDPKHIQSISSQLKEIEESISTSQILNIESSSALQAIDSQELPGSQDSVDLSQIKNFTGHVRETEYGTPVLNIASSYLKLPSDDKFAKDICDVINFENLPNSTGKYKNISALLKKVKSEVDRIQES